MAAAPAAAPTLEALLSAQTIWRAGARTVAQLDGEPTGHAALDAWLPQGGWPRGALTELLLPADGVGELQLLLPTVARLTRDGGIVALVAPPYVPYAPAWQAAGVDLHRLEIVDADARGALWAFEQCLRSGACVAVLGWPSTGDGQALRRLQVAADSGECLGFALRDRRHAINASPAALRLEHAQGAWHVRKCRGRRAPTDSLPVHVLASPPPALSAQADVRDGRANPGGATLGAATDRTLSARVFRERALTARGSTAVASTTHASTH